MSTEEVARLWENVRNTRHPLRWLISVVNDKFTHLVPVASGNGGLTEFLEALRDVSGIVHAGFKVTGVDERGSVKSIRGQFVKVTMMTDDVPQLKRAKALPLKDACDRAFSGANVVLDISSADDIDKADLERRLASAAGAHKPGRYDFEGVEDDLQQSGPASPSSPQKPPVVEKEVESTAVEQSTAEAAVEKKDGDEEVGKPATENEVVTATEPKDADADASTASPTKEDSTEQPPAASPVAVAIEEGPVSIDVAWSRVHDEKHANNFLVVTFDGKDPKSAEIVATGSGNLDAFKSHLADDKPMYGGFRLRAIDDRGSVVSVRPKIIFVSMIGKGVKPVVRAQAGAVKSHFDSMFSGHHIPLFVSDASELTEEDIVQRLRQSGGAHQPNRYDFSGKKGQDV